MAVLAGPLGFCVPFSWLVVAALWKNLSPILLVIRSFIHFTRAQFKLQFRIIELLFSGSLQTDV